MRALILSLLVACSAGDATEQVATTTPPSDESGAALAFAKACIERDGLKTVWGSTMDFTKVTTLHARDRVWLVDVPESGYDAAGRVVMLGLPMGLWVEVDLDAKTCRQVRLE